MGKNWLPGRLLFTAPIKGAQKDRRTFADFVCLGIKNKVKLGDDIECFAKASSLAFFDYGTSETCRIRKVRDEFRNPLTLPLHVIDVNLLIIEIIRSNSAEIFQDVHVFVDLGITGPDRYFTGFAFMCH